MMTSNPNNHKQEDQQFIKSVLRILRNPWVRVVIIGIMLFFAGFYVSRQFESIKILLNDVELQIFRLVLSTILVLCGVSLGIALWWFTLSGFGKQLNLLKATRIHVISTLAKYIPGFIWQFSSKAYLSINEGVPVRIAGFSMAIEIGFSLLSGTGIALLLTPLVNHEILPISFGLTNFLQIVGIILLVVMVVSPRIIARAIKTTTSYFGLKVNPIYWLGAIVIIISAWMMLSTALYFLTSSFGLPGLRFLECVLVICGSYVAGILVFFVPNGIVVREAAMVALLPTGYEPGAALLLSIVARLQVVFGEILLSLLIVGLMGLQNRKSKIRT